VERFRRHLPEYASEACCLGLFMIAATGCAVALLHPRSPLGAASLPPLVQRIPMGIAMGLTAALLIYSPLGRRSGAHMNPAVTLAFLRLGKIARIDAVGYVAAQFAGGILGIAVALPLFAFLPADPAVNYVATAPGAAGDTAACAAEAAISLLMMLTVLALSTTPRFAHLTGIAAALLVASFITFEAPLSGMSMNPARTLGSAVFAHSASLWIYFVAPPLGMLAAAELFVRIGVRAGCAKLHHPPGVRCIHCGQMAGHVVTRPAYELETQ